MLTLELNIGMASKYFITDLDRSIAVIENPFLFLSKERIGISLLAGNLAKIYNNMTHPVIFDKGKLGADKFEIFLNDLVNAGLDQCKSSVSPMTFDRPILIVSNSIDKMALVAMKILKIRGICQLLAIDVSTLEHDETIFRLEMELRTQEFYKDEALQLYKTVKGLSAVCGINKAILSNELKIKQIISKYPDMAMKFDEKTMPEPLK
jgi:hypothetical protein